MVRHARRVEPVDMNSLEILTAVAAVLLPTMSMQTFWVVRALNRIDDRLDRMDDRFDRMDDRFDRMDDRFDHLDRTIVRDHGERISRLEARRL
jgi:hypothetical protein